MLKKLTGLVLLVCALAAAVHFIPWPRFYDHTLKGVVLEYSVDKENTTVYTAKATEVTMKLDMVQKHYMLSDMVIGGEIQMGNRTLETSDVNRWDKAQMNNIITFPEDHVWKNDVEDLFGTTLFGMRGLGIGFVTMYSNYDMSYVILMDSDTKQMYLLSKEPFDLEETLSYFGKYDTFFFDNVV